jgi:ribonuclease III
MPLCRGVQEDFLVPTESGPSKPRRRSLLEKKLGYKFKKPELLKLALTHPSSTIEKLTDNERLEFLGDSVLGLSVNEYLFKILPEAPEGELTRIKSAVVSTTSLAQVSHDIDLSAYMLIGKGLGCRDDLPDSVHANVTEAIFAAVYLDAGYRRAMKLIVKLLKSEIERIAALAGRENAKSQLQELCQKRFGYSPRYRVISESGPQHDKVFLMGVEINGRIYGEVAGNNKKEAEQGVARIALDELESCPETEDYKGRTDPEISSASPAMSSEEPPTPAPKPKPTSRKKTATSKRTPRKKAASKKTTRKKAPATKKTKARKKTPSSKNPYDQLTN